MNLIIWLLVITRVFDVDDENIEHGVLLEFTRFDVYITFYRTNCTSIMAFIILIIDWVQKKKRNYHYKA